MAEIVTTDAEGNPIPPWMAVAESYLGVAELKSSKSNPIIVKFFSEAGHPEVQNEEVAWCAAFVGACLHEGGVEGDHSLWARDYLAWEGAVPVSEDEVDYGDIVIFRRGPVYGHVGFFDTWVDESTLRVLGGNQSDQVKYSNFLKVNAIGYRRVKSWSKPSSS